jgi:pimeloyl-ACP methyl ester carboxylesterase
VSEVVTTSLGDRVAFDRRGAFGHDGADGAGAYDRGAGPAVVFVAGAGPWREIDQETTSTADLLQGRGVASIVYDRLGRGESPARGPITLEREVAALAAMIEAAGGDAVLCGHSSGCSIALYAAAQGVPVAGLALWEAPLAPPDSGAREWAAEIGRLLDDGNLDGALTAYMKDMPPEILEAVRSIPAMVPQAGSLRPDAESLAWAESAPLAELCAGIRVPVLAMIGEETYEIMVSAAESIAAAIPGAERKRLPGARHGWEPEPMAAELAAFVARIRH